MWFQRRILIYPRLDRIKKDSYSWDKIWVSNHIQSTGPEESDSTSIWSHLKAQNFSVIRCSQDRISTRKVEFLPISCFFFSTLWFKPRTVLWVPWINDVKSWRLARPSVNFDFAVNLSRLKAHPYRGFELKIRSQCDLLIVILITLYKKYFVYFPFWV